MGAITIVISDEVEERLRIYLFKKYKGKGRHMGEEVEKAIVEYLDLHEEAETES